MKTLRQMFWLMTLSAFLLMTCGCTSTHLRPIQVELERDGSGLHEKSGQKISGYELLDGTQTDYNGWAKLAGQDSLSFWKSRYVPESDADEGAIIDDSQEAIRTSGPMLATATIKSLKIVESSPAKTVLAVLVAPIVLIVTIVGVSMIAADSGNIF